MDITLKSRIYIAIVSIILAISTGYLWHQGYEEFVVGIAIGFIYLSANILIEITNK